jgi:hypothetical protein
LRQSKMTFTLREGRELRCRWRFRHVRLHVHDVPQHQPALESWPAVNKLRTARGNICLRTSFSSPTARWRTSRSNLLLMPLSHCLLSCAYISLFHLWHCFHCVNTPCQPLPSRSRDRKCAATFVTLQYYRMSRYNEEVIM